MTSWSDEKSVKRQTLSWRRKESRKKRWKKESVKTEKFGKKLYTDTHSDAYFFCMVTIWRTFDAPRAPQHFLRFKVGLKSHFIKSLDADLSCLSVADINSFFTNWHSCDLSLWLPHLRDNSSYCLTVRWIRAERDLTQKWLDAWWWRHK